MGGLWHLFVPLHALLLTQKIPNHLRCVFLGHDCVLLVGVAHDLHASDVPSDCAGQGGHEWRRGGVRSPAIDVYRGTAVLGVLCLEIRGRGSYSWGTVHSGRKWMVYILPEMQRARNQCAVGV